MQALSNKMRPAHPIPSNGMAKEGGIGIPPGERPPTVRKMAPLEFEGWSNVGPKAVLQQEIEHDRS